MNALMAQATPPLLQIAVFLSVLATALASESVILRVYDWLVPPVTMTWQAEVLQDGRHAVRFSGYKHRGECKLVIVRAWGQTRDGPSRIEVTKLGGAGNRDHGVGPFGPSPPWILVPPPVGQPRIVAEFDCHGRDVQVDVRRAP